MGDEADTRHHLFASACDLAGWSARQAWLGYFALGGRRDFFDIDGFLEGFVTLEAHEQDVLAVALNERLHDLYLAGSVPYLLGDRAEPTSEVTPVQALAALVARGRTDPSGA